MSKMWVAFLLAFCGILRSIFFLVVVHCCCVMWIVRVLSYCGKTNVTVSHCSKRPAIFLAHLSPRQIHLIVMSFCWCALAVHSFCCCIKKCKECFLLCTATSCVFFVCLFVVCFFQITSLVTKSCHWWSSPFFSNVQPKHVIGYQIALLATNL